MKKRLALIAVFLLLCACSVSMIRGSGRRVTESRQVQGFDRVALTGSGTLILTQGEDESLTVETDDNLMQYVVTEVEGGGLTLGTKSGMSLSPTRLRFTLTVVDLHGLAVSGSGDAEMARLDTDELEVTVSGSGSVRVDALAADRAEVRISGSGTVELAGQVSRQEVEISGSGKYRGGDLRSETVSATIGGSGDATVWATESLDARVTGSGSVGYYGDPRTDVTGGGSGRVRRLGSK